MEPQTSHPIKHFAASVAAKPGWAYVERSRFPQMSLALAAGKSASERRPRGDPMINPMSSFNLAGQLPSFDAINAIRDFILGGATTKKAYRRSSNGQSLLRN